MHKRLLSTLLVGAMLTASIVGLSACDNGNDDGATPAFEAGEQVTEQQWNDAFEKLYTAKNLTVFCYVSETDEIIGQDYHEAGYATATAVQYVDFTNGEIYFERTEVGHDSDMDEDYEDTERSYTYVEGSTVWQCEDYEEGWFAHSDKNVSDEEIEELFEFEGFSNEMGVTVPSAFSDYTYVDGFYVATFDARFESLKFTVSVKGGYVIGVQLLYVLEDDNEKVIFELNRNWVFSNYGSTVVNAPAAAKKAIQNAKGH